VAKVKAWRQGSPGEPKFPEDFEVVKKAVLQVTDIKSNHNKYYGIELHRAGTKFRVFTHYGRTDDLETNPNAGAKESRYYDDFLEAEACYRQIYGEKTSASIRQSFIRKPTVPRFMPNTGQTLPRLSISCSVCSMKPSPPKATISSASSGGTKA
jgi:hypothetical protein